jgi:hypothetical protein
MKMQQKINLYELLPKPSKSYITPHRLMMVYGLFIILLVFQWLLNISEKHRLINEHLKAAISLDEANQRFKNLISQYPTIDTKNIKNIADTMRAELNNELKIIQLLELSSKFSAYMQGLAEASFPNVWLTNILFSSKEPRIVLQGAAVQALYAQQYLDQLNHQSVFNGLPFKINDLTQTQIKKSDVFTFNISTKLKSTI